MSLSTRRLVYLLGVLAFPAGAAEQVETRIVVSDRLAYDGNLYRVSDELRLAGHAALGVDSFDDLINQLAIAFDVVTEPGRQRLSLSGQVNDTRFRDNESLGNTGASAGLAWDWRLGSRLSGELAARYARQLSGFANTGFFGKDMLTVREYRGSLRHAVGPHWRLTAGARRSESSHSNEARRADGNVITGGSAGAEYVTDEDNSVALAYRVSSGEPAVPAGVRYDDDLFEVRVKHMLRPEWSLEASAGYLLRRYPDAALHDFSGAVGRADLHWQPTAKSHVDFAAWRELTANIDSESDYFETRGFSIGPGWSPTVRIMLQATFSWEKQHYVGSEPAAAAARMEYVRAGTLSISYAPREAWAVVLAGRKESRSSNRALRQYDDDILSLTVRYTR